MNESKSTFPDFITGWGMRRILTDWLCEKRNITDEDDDDFLAVEVLVDELIEHIEEETGAKFDWPKPPRGRER